MCCLHKAPKCEIKGWDIHGKAVPYNLPKVSERGESLRQRTRAELTWGPCPRHIFLIITEVFVISTAALDRVPVWFVFCSGWACLFFSLKYFKPHLIFLDRQRGDSNVGFFPPSINKSSEKPTHYSVFSSGLYYLNLLGGLEEHKHIFQWHQLWLGELWAPAIVPSCQHVAWCHRAGGGTRGDDSHSEAEQHLLLPPRCVWTQPSLFGSSNGSFKISFRGWNCWLRGSQSENCTDPKSLHFGAAGCKS